MKRISLLFALPLALGAQTLINGGRVFKGTLDASGAASTLPHRTGTGSPVGRDSCGKPGETYFQTDAPAGQNVWGCMAAGTPGTWNQMTASLVTGTTGPGGACSVGALYIRTDVPQFYVCSATNAWQLASYGSNILASRPSSCVAGQVFLATDAGTLWFCSTPGSPGTWKQLGGALASVFGRTGAVTAQAGDYAAAQVTNAAAVNAPNTWSGGFRKISAQTIFYCPSTHRIRQPAPRASLNLTQQRQAGSSAPQRIRGAHSRRGAEYLACSVEPGQFWRSRATTPLRK
jgi:hypothetical protein